MGPAKAHCPSLPEPLTWADICQRYPKQQLCLVDVDYTDPEEREIRTARVIGHGDSMDTAFEQARLFADRFEHFTFYATRPWHRLQPLRPQLVMDDELRALCFNVGPARFAHEE